MIRYVEGSESASGVGRGIGEFVMGFLFARFQTTYSTSQSERFVILTSAPKPLPPEIVDSIKKLAEYVRMNLDKFDLEESSIHSQLVEIDAVPPQ